MRHINRTEPAEGEIECFSCEAGCVHFEYGPVLITFRRERFLEVAKMFEETRRAILNEESDIHDWSDEIFTEN